MELLPVGMRSYELYHTRGGTALGLRRVLCHPGEVSLPGVLGLRLDLALDSDSRVIEVDAVLRSFRVRRCFIQF